MSSFVDVAIIGAGPYGLSLAAHLANAGISYRVIGQPMSAWQRHMVAGMFLKSDGPSSNLSDPSAALTLEQYCQRHGLEFQKRIPIPRETFINYGLDFQKRFVTELCPQLVEQLERETSGYTLKLSDGEILTAARVVIAVGVEPFNYVPTAIASLGPSLVSHSSKYGAVDGLKDRDVAVLGAGASATDVAYALHQAGARPQIISRRREIAFQKTPEPQTLLQKLRHPDSGIGGGWRLKTCADAPFIVHALPLRLRQRIVRNYLGAAPGWFMRARIEGAVPVLNSTRLLAAEAVNDRVRLRLVTENGPEREMTVDHVVAATGYKIDLARLPFMPSEILASIRNLGGAPILSGAFETSLNGLYVIGPAAALSFGPVMRFVYGADYAVRQVSRHLSHGLARRSMTVPVLARS
jgi:cation diffusion facilitator CzcD-associated flavoprotein CzcO